MFRRFLMFVYMIVKSGYCKMMVICVLHNCSNVFIWFHLFSWLFKCVFIHTYIMCLHACPEFLTWFHKCVYDVQLFVHDFRMYIYIYSYALSIINMFDMMLINVYLLLSWFILFFYFYEVLLCFYVYCSYAFHDFHMLCLCRAYVFVFQMVLIRLSDTIVMFNMVFICLFVY